MRKCFHSMEKIFWKLAIYYPLLCLLCVDTIGNGLHCASFPGSVLEITISSSGGTERGRKRTLLSNMLLKFKGSRSISALSRGYFTWRREMSSGHLNWTVPSQRTMFHFHSLWWLRSLWGSASATRPIFIWKGKAAKALSGAQNKVFALWRKTRLHLTYHVKRKNVMKQNAG